MMPEHIQIELYSADIPLRGFSFSLETIRAAYRELSASLEDEANREIAKLTKPDDWDDARFKSEKEKLKKHAFKATVSIIGGKDNITLYGESEDIFSSRNIPFPVKTIYITNETAFKNIVGDKEPNNRFNIWIDFTKPSLFDPSPLLSEPTRNTSRAVLNCDNLTFFNAVQNIVKNNMKSKNSLFSFIHGKLSYDVGSFLIATPYSIYTASDLVFKNLKFQNNIFLQFGSFVYLFFIFMIVYRFIFSYIKWAFPINVLEQNNDTSKSHRYILGTMLLGLIVNIISKIFGA